MEDLFDREQRILDEASSYEEKLRDGLPCDAAKYEQLVKEYGRLLRQLRRITRISDKTTIDLNASKLNLLEKVHYDTLTGIYSRAFMEENVIRIIETMKHAGGGLFGLLMIDIDYFKRYNDTYGHSMGDDCLRAVAKALRESLLREGDFVARYGGEEFVAVLPHTDQRGVDVIAERMLDSVRDLRIPHRENEAVDYVTISIGATVGDVRYVQNGKEYIKRADKALYQSKQAGRNQYNFIELGEIL